MVEAGCVSGLNNVRRNDMTGMYVKQVAEYRRHLFMEEKSRATIEKYIRDVEAFCVFLNERCITKELVIEYKRMLGNVGYAVRSINSIISSLNSFLEFIGMHGSKVKSMRVQREIYQAKERQLNKSEYRKLLLATKKNSRMFVLLQTICSTGIRVSELKFFTVENIRKGEVTIKNKGKIRRILIPQKLRKLVTGYAKSAGITSGVVFRTRNGNALDRSNIWREMKKLSLKAGVDPGKVFPHNLRKLFARLFYKAEKDIVKLADLLGHGNINTTRIYIMTTSDVFREKIEQLDLVYTT